MLKTVPLAGPASWLPATMHQTARRMPMTAAYRQHQIPMSIRHRNLRGLSGVPIVPISNEKCSWRPLPGRRRSCPAAIPEGVHSASSTGALATAGVPAIMMAFSAGLATIAAKLQRYTLEARGLVISDPINSPDESCAMEEPGPMGSAAPSDAAPAHLEATLNVSETGLSQDARASSSSTVSGNVSAAESDTASQAQQIWTAAWRHFDWPAADSAGSSASRSGASKERSETCDRKAQSEQSRIPVTSAESPQGVAVASRALRGANSPEAITRAQFALQGLEAGARAQLLALSLCALEQQVAALSDSAAEATAEEWRVLVGALLASCSLAAARAWLGYTPVDLQAQAASLVSKCQLGGNESQIALLERSMVADGPQPGAEPTAVPGLWGMASEKALLHASVLRYLRYGPLPAPGFRRSTAGAPLSVEDALDDPSGVESTAASTELLSAAGEDIDKVSAAGIQVGHDAMADDGRGGQLIDGGVGTAPRQQAAAMLGRQPNSIRGWRQRQLAASAQDSLLPHAPMVLQDMATGIAEAVATAYLAEVRAGVAGAPSARDPGGSALLGSGAWPTFLHRRLSSTRALERFRNQVAFEQWMRRSYWTVAAMYEDRHDLVALAPEGNLVRLSIPAKRTKELEGLTGWRSLVCLLLELADVAAPILGSVFARLSTAMSWLLVILIGRSLGLVFRGVRESLNKGDKGPGAQRAAAGRPKQKQSWWPSVL